MNCIDPDQVQKYIDKEVSPEEAVLIEGHIKHCEACAIRIYNQLELATQVKDAINLLTEETVDIPKFKIPKSQKKWHVITSKRLIYSVAAACIIIIILIIFQTNYRADESNEYYMQLVEYEYDANRTLSEQKLVIEFIDPNGNITEYFLE